MPQNVIRSLDHRSVLKPDLPDDPRELQNLGTDGRYEQQWRRRRNLPVPWKKKLDGSKDFWQDYTP